MKKILVLLLVASFFVSCGGGSSEAENQDTAAEAVKTTDEVSPPSGPDVSLFVNVQGTPHTWVAQNGDYIFFREDGTLAGGGADGEESMYEGEWKVQDGVFLWNINGAGWEEVDLQLTESNLTLNGTVFDKVEEEVGC